MTYKAIKVRDMPGWTDHGRSRFATFAKLTGASSKLTIDPGSMELILPSAMDTSELITRLPVGDPARAGAWIKRPDAIGLAIPRLRELARRTSSPMLVCYSEYARPKDPVLAKRDHIVFGDAVFLIADFDRDSDDAIARAIRQARSRLIMAILSNDLHAHLKEGDIFVTDAFDADFLTTSRICA